MPRPQFSIRTLLWLTLVVAAFLGGMLFSVWRNNRRPRPPLPAAPTIVDDVQLFAPPKEREKIGN